MLPIKTTPVVHTHSHLVEPLAQKNLCPFLHSTLWKNWGEGICSNIISLKHTPPPFLMMLCTRSIRMTTTAFWKNHSFAECAVQEISGACDSSNNKQGYSDFVHMHLRTQSTTELNQNLTNIMPRRQSLQDCYT